MPMEPRRVYLDTEFLITDPTTAGLVSVALTDDAGLDYVAVNAEMDAFHVYNHSWMRANVWPFLPTAPNMPHRLDFTHPDVKPLSQIVDEIAAYFDTGRETHLYAYYGAQDMFRIHSLWGHDWDLMPRQVPRWFFDIKALCVQAGNPEMPVQQSGAHDPLADARHNRVMHEHLRPLLGALPPDEALRRAEDQVRDLTTANLEAAERAQKEIDRLRGEVAGRTDGCTEDREYEVVGGWGVDGARDEAHARHQVSVALAQYPGCGARAQWRIVRTWDDGAQYCGPWNDLDTEDTK